MTPNRLGLKVAIPSGVHHAPPFFNYSGTQNTGKNNKTNSLHLHLPLRRPERMDDQIEPQTLNPKPTAVNDYGMDKVNTRSKASDVLRLMDCLSLQVTPDIYSCLIKECIAARDVRGARELHTHIGSSGVTPTMPLLNRLLLMYVSCGDIHIAHKLFDEMPKRDFYSWAILILGYIRVRDYHEAVALFENMVKTRKGVLKVPPWIMGCILKACVTTGNLALGKQVHGLCIKLGFGGADSFLSESLVRFYGKFGCLRDANFVIDQLLHSNTLVWAAKMANNCKQGHFYEVIRDFNEMGRCGIKKNPSIFSSLLKACGRIGDGGKCGKQVHADAIKLGLEANDFVGCGLVEIYGKCGLVGDAKRVFEAVADEMNTMCWNAMVVGYMQNEFYVEAIKLLYRMKALGMEVNETLFDNVRIACGSNT